MSEFDWESSPYCFFGRVQGSAQYLIEVTKFTALKVLLKTLKIFREEDIKPVETKVIWGVKLFTSERGETFSSQDNLPHFLFSHRDEPLFSWNSFSLIHHLKRNCFLALASTKVPLLLIY